MATLMKRGKPSMVPHLVEAISRNGDFIFPQQFHRRLIAARCRVMLETQSGCMAIIKYWNFCRGGAFFRKKIRPS
jgi:hypothetical protein